jgi:cell shape-determining protein MreD
MRPLVWNILRFIILVPFQALVIHKIEFGDYSSFFNGFLYVLFILMLPFETPKWLTLTLAFALGISLDMFSGTIGMHASACVLMAFARPRIMKILASSDEYEFRNKPTIHVMGFRWYVSYAFLLCVLHHFWFFLVENFRFTEIHIILLKTLGSALFTTFLIVLTQYLFFSRRKENG